MLLNTVERIIPHSQPKKYTLNNRLVRNDYKYRKKIKGLEIFLRLFSQTQNY